MAIKKNLYAKKPNYTYNLKFGNFYFFDSFFITEIFEGVVITKPLLLEVIDLAKKHFDIDKPYGMISHRKYSYSIDLLDILSVYDGFGLLKINAVVAYSKLALQNLEVEKLLLKVNGKAFTNLEEAINWTEAQVKKIQV